jgi:hypothetical protein
MPLRRKSAESRASSKDANPLSDEDVARFLKQLSIVHRDRRTGNPALADALLRVSRSLIDGSCGVRTISPEGGAAEGEHPELALEVKNISYEKLEADDIDRLIRDSGTTKIELIELAASRFGMPRSKLLRLSLDSVRDALRSALMHEASLTVITEEAARSGARRQS